MLYNYIFVYKSISFKNCKIVSPATFVNKLETVGIVECLPNIGSIHTINQNMF